MKARLYAVRIHSKWEWHVTLDRFTDIHYWFGQHGPDTGMLMLEPLLSLGQARRICDQLTLEHTRKVRTKHKNDENEHTRNETPPLFTRETHSPSYAALTKASLTALTQRIKALATRCGIKSTSVEAIRITPIPYESWREGAYPDFHLEQLIYNQIVQAMSGRSLLVEEVGQLLEHQGLDPETLPWMSYVQLAHLQGDLTITSGLTVEEFRELKTFWKKSTSYRCKRCGSGKDRMFWSACIFCGGDCPYCEECLTMGRTRYCSLLILGGSVSEGRKFQTQHSADRQGTVTPGKAVNYQESIAYRQSSDYQESIAPWGLSTAQAAASLEGLKFIDRGYQRTGPEDGRATSLRGSPSKFLIWAVTGAGKTEMIFPFIRHVAECGGKVLVATPRKDVVLELQPRLMKAFAGRSVVTLYGGSEQRWEQGDITIATTHQLLRFYEAFDLVIIDEIDAFPYHNNPVLEYAAHKVCHPDGGYILLSATPPRQVRKAVRRGKLPYVKVPVRFHRHPLPVPELVAMPSLRQIVKSGKLPAALRSRLLTSMERGAQLFVFVPSIKLVELVVGLLRKELTIREDNIHDDGASQAIESAEEAVLAFGPIEGTSSKDLRRTEKVQSFRDRSIRLLVTTTILERGVTVPKSDVYILDSDSGLFDEAALVQMSGRAGRSKDDPSGKVYFAAKERTKSQSEAIKQIKDMNRLARKQGYFKGDNH